MAYEDTVLLRINRTYGRDESVAFLIGQIGDLKREIKANKFEIGILKSEKAELQYRLNKLPEVITVTKEIYMERKVADETDPYVKKLRETLQKTFKARTEMRNKARTWRDKYFSLLNQIERNSIK